MIRIHSARPHLVILPLGSLNLSNTSYTPCPSPVWLHEPFISFSFGAVPPPPARDERSKAIGVKELGECCGIWRDTGVVQRWLAFSVTILVLPASHHRPHATAIFPVRPDDWGERRVPQGAAWLMAICSGLGQQQGVRAMIATDHDLHTAHKRTTYSG